MVKVIHINKLVFKLQSIHLSAFGIIFGKEKEALSCGCCVDEGC